MKMRRTVVALFLMVAILTLGIGYAALSDTLEITANVNTPGFDTKVGFTAWDITEGKRNAVSVTDVEGTDETDDEFSVSIDETLSTAAPADKITLNVDGFLVRKDDSITMTFTVSNLSKFAVTLNTPSVTGATGIFTATATLDKTSLAKDETATLTVKINMIDDIPAGTESATANFTITVNAQTATTP